MSWATPDALRALAADMSLRAPSDDDQAQRLLDQATRDLELHVLHVRDLETDGLSESQLGALSRAACLQALWRLEMDTSDVLGVDDRITGLGGDVTFIARPTVRYSAAAAEELALYGLIAYSGTVLPEPAPAAPTWPWWLG